MKAPAIVIGIGGIGSEICAKVMQMMPDEAPGKKNIRFVAIDTDVNSLRALKRNGFLGETVQLSNNITLAKCLDYSGEEIKKWYPRSELFYKKSMTEGAGQVRAISRLALDFAIGQGRLKPIYKTIRELHEVKVEGGEQGIRFYIISSLAGGTGSGILLPLAMHLEHYIIKELGDNKSVCKGFFVLPSVLRGIAGNDLERESLDANAYAALREISAFMKVEYEKRERYRDLKLHLADEDNDRGYDSQSAAYEFCFLFGMVNAKDAFLRSFGDLKDMVAKSVYMQACSPIEGKNNSLEDNLRVNLAKEMEKRGERDLRRFGGIGCGEAVYPYQSIREYVALKWAMEAMEGEWKRYDENFFEKEREQIERRKKGEKVTPIYRGNEYISIIANANSGDLFAELIRDQCRIDGEKSWQGYLNSLQTYVKDWVQTIREERYKNEDREGELDRYFELLYSGSRIKKKEKQDFANKIIIEFKVIRQELDMLLATQWKYLAERLFCIHMQVENDPYEIEYWLKKEGQYIHPNAVRYFLYQLKKELKMKMSKTQDLVRRIKGRLEYCKNDSESSKKSVKDCIEVGKKYEKALDDLYEYVFQSMFFSIMEACDEYISSLIQCYEDFYDFYGEMLNMFDEDIETITEELDRDSGITSAYICADKACRNEIMEKIRSGRAMLYAGSALSCKIYQLMQKPVKTWDDKKNCLQEIRQHWIASVEQEFGEWLNVDILQAMDLENELKHNKHLNLYEFQACIENLKDKLSTPFIKCWKAEKEEGISICCYNSSLEHLTGVYSDVWRWLKDEQGVDDEFYCSKYKLMFYRSVVGIAPHEVLEFAHKKNCVWEETGIAYDHYRGAVEHMTFSDDGMPVLTPHVDKDWHNYYYMPDIEWGNQETEEIRIGVLFLFAKLYEYIKDSQSSGSIVYRFTYTKQDMGDWKNLMECHLQLYKRYDLQSYMEEKLWGTLNEERLSVDLFENSGFKNKIENGALLYIISTYEREMKQMLIAVKPDIQKLLIMSMEQLIGLFAKAFEGNVDNVLKTEMRAQYNTSCFGGNEKLKMTFESYLQEKGY